MADSMPLNEIKAGTSADKALKVSGVFWFLVAVIGQWAFVYYIVVHYGGAIVEGNPEAWGKSSVIGYQEGNLAGNLFFASHVLMAATITFGGTLQVVPQIRAWAISLHRWNGRIFFISAFVMSLGGLYLVWVREATTSAGYGITLNAILIMAFVVLAWRNVRAGKIDNHRRWAMRTFIAVNGVWFFRVGLFMWIILNQGPVGIGEDFNGPFITFLSVACYLLPLIILEFYLRAQDSKSMTAKITMAASLFIMTILMGVGIGGAYMFMWKPFL